MDCEKTREEFKFLGGSFTHIEPIYYRCLNNSFQYLNNITCIFTHFFTHIYFQKIQIMLLEQHYQMAHIKLE